MTTLQVASEVITVLMSLLLSVFVGGMRAGSMQSELRYISDRLAKIEGMFTLTVKDGKEGK